MGGMDRAVGSQTADGASIRETKLQSVTKLQDSFISGGILQA
jgi:hypothetical protein